jgi:hypothetical protein
MMKKTWILIPHQAAFPPLYFIDPNICFRIKGIYQPHVYLTALAGLVIKA